MEAELKAQAEAHEAQRVALVSELDAARTELARLKRDAGGGNEGGIGVSVPGCCAVATAVRPLIAAPS